MATMSVMTKTFTGENGQPVNYRVLAISGTINGKLYNVEFKGSQAQLDMADMILNSTENPKTVFGTISQEEENDFLAE